MQDKTDKINQNKNPETSCHPLLPAFMKILAVILFFYWGLTHLIRPEWYLVTVMGISQYDPANTYDAWSANLMGVLNIAFAITIWRASYYPVRFKIIIDMILIVSIGTLLVFIYSLLARGLSSREWFNVGLIAGSIVILLYLYPKSGKR
ncbi:MAG: hypothetical protein NTY09_06375 [bacterium]|nr:hypothetical protein [bacterium]